MAFAYNETNNIFGSSLIGFSFAGDAWFGPTSGSWLHPTATGPITITQDGVIQSDLGTALYLGGGVYTTTVNGQLMANGTSAGGSGIGLWLDTAPVVGISKIVVGDTGNIYGTDKGLEVDQAVSVTNAGTIGGNIGVSFIGAGVHTLINTGTIWTPNTAPHDAIYGYGSGVLNITNSGDINGRVFVPGGMISKVINTGWIGGEVQLNGPTSTITNSGTIYGLVATYLGNDIVTNSGSIMGLVDLDEGNNKLVNSGDVYGTGGSTVAQFGSGDDTLNNTGHLWDGDVYFGDGKNILTNSGKINGGIFAGIGDDAVTNSGQIAFIRLDAGNNKISNSGTIDTTGLSQAIILGSGNDIVVNTGKILNGFVSLDLGINSLTNSGTIGASVYGLGKNTITNSGTITGDIGLYIGDDIVKNIGHIQGNVELGHGINTLSNSGAIDGGVFAGTGLNTITNIGTINGDIRIDDGNDILKNSGHINGNVDMGGGDDTVVGSIFRDIVTDYHGRDSYALGGGNDLFQAVYAGNLALNDGTGDKVDGGANLAVNISAGIYGDIYDASQAIQNIYINADSVSHGTFDDLHLPFLVAAGTAVGQEIGFDFISNFETYFGGIGHDVIYGNANANYIVGSFGNDHLHGGAGRDFIDGGSDSDAISGDAGADVLRGGLGHDQFIFHKLSDSTVGKLGRDVITDFTSAQDSMDFRPMAIVNGHMNAGPSFIDTAFDGAAGAMRLLTNTEGWLVQLDVNGDKTVDMSIQVNDIGHTLGWVLQDFLFV